MSLLKDASSKKTQNGTSYSGNDISEVSSKLSVILLPMISYLGDLEIEN